MDKIPDYLLERMARGLNEHDRDEMAIPSYRHKNPAMRWMAWRRVEVVARHMERLFRSMDKRASLVDFGCGTGVLFEKALRGSERVIGVDLVLDSAKLLCREWGLDVELMTPDAANDEIAPQSIDIVVAAEVLEHVEPLEDALDMFKRWLKPGGTLLVSLPTESQLYQLGRRLAGFHGHYHHSNAASIDRGIQQAGFRSREREYVPLPGPLSIYWVVEYAWPG